MNSLKLKTGPLLITMGVGLLMLTEWFFDIPTVKNAAADVKTWAIIVEAFAVALGSVNLLSYHTRTAQRREPGWYGNIITIIALILFAGTGIATGVDSDVFSRMYDVVIGPAGTTMFSILCFSIISAGARTVRIKDVSSALMTTVILIALIAQIPIGEMYFPWLVDVFNWTMDIINVAGQRGIIIGAALGAFVHSLRVLAGLEHTSGAGS